MTRDRHRTVTPLRAQLLYKPRMPWLILVPFLLVGCVQGVTEARSAWLQEQLQQDNQRWLSRSPDLLQAKYEAMAASPYAYLRGSLGPWYADLARPDLERPTTGFLRSAESAEILLQGDPHPENLATVLLGPGPTGADQPTPDILSLEWIDLDAVAYGPWILDLRRAALGLSMIERELPGCDEGCLDASLRSLARAYGDELEARAAGEGDWNGQPREAGAVIAALLEEARREGVEQKRLYEKSVDGQLLLDPGLDEDGKGHLAPGPELLAQVERVLSVYPGPEGFRVLDVARRFGSGVSSRPAYRFIVLWDRGLDGREDDQLLQLREVLDPPQLPGVAQEQLAIFDDNAARLNLATHRAWSDGADRYAAAMPDGAMTFKALPWTSFHQGLDRRKIVEGWEQGAIQPRDMELLGAVIGASLAAFHDRGGLPSGERAAAVILSDLESGDLTEELLVDAAADQARLLADHELFIGLLRRFGPLLGADARPSEFP